MHLNNGLTSIPEIETEDLSRKWVPKKKHEVLKAKYKCLKKLFQIYDTSVIGILPEPNPEIIPVEDTKPNRRRKRSHRTKTDASAGTNEIYSGDINSDFENTSVATAIIRELQIDQSCISTQIDKVDKYAETISNISENLTPTELKCKCHEKENDYASNHLPYAHPYLFLNERRKLTRLQCFVQRLFGIRRESYQSKELLYPASDPTLTNHEKRRRRGLRFRRIRRAKQIRSDTALSVKSPAILSCVQSVQRDCLMDMTVRQCPIVGCKMITYGIINYNDHLNLVHFKDRKAICHYCHEGFENEQDRLAHENEHIGISKLAANYSSLSTSNQASKIASITQTDPGTNIPEEKLKKIVSFFDKISHHDQVLSEIKKNRSSESNLRSNIDSSNYSESEPSDKTRTVSCCNVLRRSEHRCPSSGDSLVACTYCGENFRYRRQLSLHVDLEHRVHDKFSKFHSCAGIINRPHVDMVSEDGHIKVHSDRSSTASATPYVGLSTSSTITDDETVPCDHSDFYTSTETIRKPSVMDSLVKKVRSYRWEPGTKIIRV